jgi:DNA-binding NtrC family response regulator
VSTAAAVSAAQQPRIVVVDDEPVVQDVLNRLLTRAGYHAEVAATAAEGIALVEREDPDLVILDVMLPDRNGLEVLRAIKEADPEKLVIMMTAYGSVDNAVEAMKQGAFHYVTKPFSNDEVLLLVQKALDTLRLREENRLLRSLLSGDGRFEGIVGRSQPIRQVFRLVEQMAPSPSTVLIVGESGTGKELVARAIHNRSPRSAAPFFPVHSAGIPSELMESNLFGHAKGAFTGATSNKEGLFRAADGGTVFLDEIGTLRPELQTKLLRVMQERNFMPVGSTETVSVDVRILAATNVDLKTLVKQDGFREDLYYRLNVLKIQLPPLRERREDIRALAAFFLNKYALENHKPIQAFEPAALEALVAHSWPGNVRELENAVIQGVVLAPGNLVRLADLPVEVRQSRTAREENGKVFPEGYSLSQSVATYERQLIEDALDQSGGVQRRAARLLGIRPTTLNEKIKRFGIRIDS